MCEGVCLIQLFLAQVLRPVVWYLILSHLHAGLACRLWHWEPPQPNRPYVVTHAILGS